MELKKVKTEEFYPVLEYWWDRHSFPSVSKEIVPKDVFVLLKKSTPTHAVFLYETNSNLCWLGFPVSNPDVSKIFKKDGLETLIKKTTKYAESIGYKVIFTTSPVRPVQDALLKNGFSVGDIKVNHYLKTL